MAGVEGDTPAPGDVIVRREAGNPCVRYSVREFPGVPQVSYAAFEVALDVATRFARSAGTTLWYEQGDRLGLIESRTVSTR
jgi:hypothetical protein